MNIQDDKPSEKATGSRKRKHDEINPVSGLETADDGPYTWPQLFDKLNQRGKKPRNPKEEHESLQETSQQVLRDNETLSPTQGSFEPAQVPDIDLGNTLSPSVTDVPDREGEASEEGGSRTFVDVTDKSSETEEWCSSGDDPESDASSSSKD
ncbi:hypothetical protein ACHAPA_004594 [Fusarium lateritium]